VSSLFRKKRAKKQLPENTNIEMSLLCFFSQLRRVTAIFSKNDKGFCRQPQEQFEAADFTAVIHDSAGTEIALV
jgi:hypothetical protein